MLLRGLTLVRFPPPYYVILTNPSLSALQLTWINCFLVIKNLTVQNAGWAFAGLGEGAPEELAIRGYHIEKADQRELVFAEAGDFEVDEPAELPLPGAL